MHFSSLALTTLMSVAHAGQIVDVAVGMDPQTNKTGLIYSPDTVTAHVGDIIRFTFFAGNHNVIESDFDHPCQDIALFDSTKARIKSPYFPVPVNTTLDQFPIFTVNVTSEDTTFLFCGQGKHCEAGMAMVINPSCEPNATETLDAYKANASMINSGSGSSGSGGPSGSSNSTFISVSGNSTSGNGSSDSGSGGNGSIDNSSSDGSAGSIPFANSTSSSGLSTNSDSNSTSNLGNPPSSNTPPVPSSAVGVLSSTILSGSLLAVALSIFALM